jgi:hypothetical protein
VTWNHIAPSLRAEIFENLCSYVATDAPAVLELSTAETEIALRLCQERRKKLLSEDEIIEDMLSAQTKTILRSDHSLTFDRNAFGYHVDCTNRYLPHVDTSNGFFICTLAELRFAQQFLDHRWIDQSVLGEWDTNEMVPGLLRQRVVTSRNKRHPRLRSNVELDLTPQRAEDAIRSQRRATWSPPRGAMVAQTAATHTPGHISEPVSGVFSECSAAERRLTD